MSASPLLTVTGLTKTFDDHRRRLFRRNRLGVTAVSDVSFELNEGETLGLVGESGSGKSTTAHAVAQLIRPSAGSIRFRGVELTTLHREDLRRARREMQIVFQDPYSSLDPRLNVWEIVEEPLRAHGIGNRRQRRADVERVLGLVHFDSALADRQPRAFSGGQRQRIAIARALVLNPRLVICDEPVSALDVSVQAQILNLLRDLQTELGLAYLFISHDLAVVRVMSDNIAVMKDGEIIEYGSADAIYKNPQQAYTRSLLAAVPVPDPVEMTRRKRQRRHADHIALR